MTLPGLEFTGKGRICDARLMIDTYHDIVVSLLDLSKTSRKTSMSSTLEGSNLSTLADMALFYSTQVDADQIDQLGHMNVRFYGIHALAGARELITQLGMFAQAELTTGSQVRFTDLYTRHYLEQLEGSPLEVWGGVLSNDESVVQMYFELRNPEREVLGATFVFKVQLQDSETNAHIPLSSKVKNAAEEARIEWPEHGKPRSVDLDSAPQELSMADVQGKKLEAREIRVIEEKNCDDKIMIINLAQYF